MVPPLSSSAFATAQQLAARPRTAILFQTPRYNGARSIWPARRGCAVDLSQKRLASGHVSAGLDVVKPATVGRNLGFLIGAASDSMTLVQWDGQDPLVLSSRSSIETSRSKRIDNKWDSLVKIGLGYMGTTRSSPSIIETFKSTRSSRILVLLRHSVFPYSIGKILTIRFRN